MDGTKQYPPPGYTQVPTEPPTLCPYPVQAGYNAQYGDPSMQQQQQQQPQPMYPQLQQPGSAYYAPAPAGQPVIVGQPQYVVGQPVIAVAVQPQVPPQQYIGTIVLAIFTSLCCGVFFGFIALMLAVAAQIVSRNNPKTAQCLGRTSIAIAVFGILITVVIVVLYFGVIVGYTAQSVEIYRALLNNETLSEDNEEFLKIMANSHLEVECREFARMTISERNGVTDRYKLQKMEKCDARTTTRRPYP